MPIKDGLQCDLNMELPVSRYRVFQRNFQAIQCTSQCVCHLKCLFRFIIFFSSLYSLDKSVLWGSEHGIFEWQQQKPSKKCNSNAPFRDYSFLALIQKRAIRQHSFEIHSFVHLDGDPQSLPSTRCLCRSSKDMELGTLALIVYKKKAVTAVCKLFKALYNQIPMG